MVRIQPLPAFSDNYIWLLSDPATGDAAVVDPGDAAPVVDAVEQLGLRLATVLITHHHGDHIGGVEALVDRYGADVIAPLNPVIPRVTRRVGEGDQVEVLGLTLRVIAVPGHTLDHIAYFAGADADRPLLFCGDTLFAGGCGRLFEGTPAMMAESLAKLAQLPAATQVYCAHEYTLANLAFATAVEPGNRALQERCSSARAARDRDQPTVPSTLELELETNPFLRSHTAEVRRAAQAHSGANCEDNIQVFATVRAWKDSF